MKPTLEEQKGIFRSLVSKMERRKNRNITIEFRVVSNGSSEVKSEYNLIEWTEPDMKSPMDWLNSCFFFYDLGKFGKGDISISIKANDANEAEMLSTLVSKGLDKFHCEYLIDLGDEEDWDGEEVAITCDTIIVIDGKLYVYDSNNENEDGSVDREDMYDYQKLDSDGKKSVWSAFNLTMQYLAKC